MGCGDEGLEFSDGGFEGRGPAVFGGNGADLAELAHFCFDGVVGVLKSGMHS